MSHLLDIWCKWTQFPHVQHYGFKLLPQSEARVLASNPLVVESPGHMSQTPFPTAALYSSGGHGVHVGP